MTIYGVGILAACFICGQLLGDLLGRFININANVGGVGFAMLLLIGANEWLNKKKFLSDSTLGGVQFWSNMYLPVIVAMSATQNVSGAATAGYVAIAAGILPVMGMILLIPVLRKLSTPKNNA